MSGAGLLLAAVLLVPAGLLLALAAAPVRARALDLLAPAPLPAIMAALLASGAPPLVFDAYGLRLSLDLQPPGALLLGAAALLWAAAGAYAARFMRDDPHAVRFAACWLLTLAGSLGCFITADLLTFYLAFALVSIPAYGMIIHDGTDDAWRAGAVTLFLAIGGEVCLLLGFALMAAAVPGPSLAITDAVAALPGSPRRALVIPLLVAGFGLKAGLVPLHVWLPLAHPAAPMPASAVLSGAIIKAGIFGLARFLPFDVAMPGWGMVLLLLGFGSAFFGVLIGITQDNPKTVLAYSSISQMGLVAATLGAGLGMADATTPWAAASYATHHVLAKGALFLAVGVAKVGGGGRPTLLGPALLLATGFGGLPPTGGYLAKLAVKDQLGSGLAGMLSTVSAIGSTALMLHFVRRLAATGSAEGGGEAPRMMRAAWLLTAAASVLVPWIVLAAGEAQAAARAWAPDAVWSATWPVLIGAGLALGLGRIGHLLPRVQGGDMVVAFEAAARAATRAIAPIARVERALRHWPAAATALLAMILLMGAAMLGSQP